MRSSSKKLAVTSVAYAVTLLVVSSAAAATLDSAKADLQTQAVSLKAESARLEALRAQAIALKATKEKEASREEYFASKRETLTGKELAELLSLVGFEGKAHKTAWAIVMRESNARPKAHNDNVGTGDNSYGIFQINMMGSLGADRRAKFELSKNEELFNPLRNAEIAYFMSGRGSDFGAWGIGPNAYRSGAGESTISRWYDSYPGAGN